MLLRLGKFVLIAVVVLAVGIQLIPYGRDHSNPPVRLEPTWDSPQTRELAVRSCYNCHSNETKWPWYSSVAPISWVTQGSVDDGRRVLNFSEWDRPQEEPEESAEEVREGSMPPWKYTIFHPNAKLSGTEQEQLIQGLVATFGGKSSKSSEGRERDDDDDDDD